VSQSLLKDGASVFGLDISPPSPEFLASLTQIETGNWYFLQCNLADAEAVATALSSWGSVPDVVINNAGWLFSAPLLRFEKGKLVPHGSADWDRALDINLNTAFYVLSQCAQQMVVAGRKGVIINISSIAAQGNVGQAAYAAAKAGVNALTVVGAKELGAFGIRVAAIAPGFIDTESTRKAVPEDVLNRIRKSIPLGQFGTPGQLYHAIKFVMENDYFHGKVLELDGGLSL